MNKLNPKQQLFLVFSPDAVLSRLQAVSLIQYHADSARVFEDFEGYTTLLVPDRGVRRLVRFADLSDAQIGKELPGAWKREHQQQDLFADAAGQVANDDTHWPEPVAPTLGQRVLDVGGAAFQLVLYAAGFIWVLWLLDPLGLQVVRRASKWLYNLWLAI